MENSGLNLLRSSGEPLLVKALKKSEENKARFNRNIDDGECRQENVIIARNITYMVVLRGEFSKQMTYKAINSFYKHKDINRHEVKKLSKTIAKMISDYDRMTATLCDDITLEYYDGLTDYYADELKGLAQTAYFSIMQAITGKAELTRLSAEILASCELASILLEYTSKRIDYEISYYCGLGLNLERLKYLSLKNMNSEFAMLNGIVAKKLFPKNILVDLNKDKNTVQAVKNLLNKMSDPVVISRYIGEYNKIFENEHKQ